LRHILWEKFLKHWNGDWKIPRPDVVEGRASMYPQQREMPLEP
jgi:hypothetical protein